MALTKLRRLTKIFFIAANIITGIFFLLGCYGGNFDQQKFWFLGFFPIAAFYFLLLLVGFFFFWLFVRPFWIVLSTLFIILAWNPLQHLLQLRLSPNFVMQKNEKNLRVMSWNVQHFEILQHKKNPQKKEDMLSMINQHMPDVACFQEMVASDSVPEAINYIPNFLEDLGFPYFHYTYNPKLDFDGEHHFGLITFSRYPIVSRHNVSYAPNDYNSIFQYVDIDRDGDTFRIFNVHLQSLKLSTDNRHFIEKPSLNDGGDLAKSRNVARSFKTGFIRRQVQSQRIRKAIDESPYPVIVCGDFNDVPNSRAYKTIGKGLKNAYTEKGTGIGRTYYGISPTLRIDHIFTDQSFTVEQFVRVKKKLSDHYPIIADIFYKEPVL